MLDKPEVQAEVTKRPRFLPWEFDTACLFFKTTTTNFCTIFFKSAHFWTGGGVKKGPETILAFLQAACKEGGNEQIFLFPSFFKNEKGTLGITCASQTASLLKGAVEY